MNQPKVSVIVPCYNVEKYLDRCMNSIINQTLKDIEIILVDDGSPDRVPEMCDEWAGKDSRIKVIHKQNGGLGYARNSGLELATAEYVAFVDSDDYIDLQIYETLYNEAVSAKADAVFCGLKKESKPGVWSESQEVTERTVFEGEDAVRKIVLGMIASLPYEKQERHYEMSVWHSIYKTSIITDNNIRFMSEREIVSEDIPFQVDFFLKAKKVVFIPDTFYHYCLNGTSLTSTYNFQKFYRYKRLHEIVTDKLKEIPNAYLHTDRCFLGDSRMLILLCIRTGGPKMHEDLKTLMDDPIWEVLKQRYYPSYLPPYQRIVYSLILRKQPHLLIPFCRFIYALRNFLGKR